MYYKSIQAFRALGAIYVCLFHILYWWNQKQDFLTGIFDRGNAGIDLFFVVSGFVIFQAARRLGFGGKAFLLFLKRRLIRIYPLYWIALLLFLTTGLVKSSNDTVLSLLQTFFLLPRHKTIIIISWTLQYELCFYLLIGLYVLNKKLKWLVLLMFFLSVLSFLKVLLPGNLTLLPPSGFYNEFTLEFFLGIVAVYASARVSNMLSFLLLISGLIFFFFPVFDVQSRAILYGIPAACMITGLTSLERNGKIRIPRWLVLTGDASYALYLIHIPVIYFILPYPTVAGAVGRLILLLLILVVVLFSILVYLYIDKPIQRLLNRHILKTLHHPKPSKAQLPAQ